MSRETWRVVAEFPDYEVSDCGLVRRRTPGVNTFPARIKSQRKAHHGYMEVSIGARPNVRKRLVHRLVAEAFIGPLCAGLQVNHKDFDRTNNRVENLEIVSASENVQYSHRNGRGRRKLSPEQEDEIRQRYESGSVSHSALAREFGLSKAGVHYAIKRGAARCAQ